MSGCISGVLHSAKFGQQCGVVTSTGQYFRGDAFGMHKATTAVSTGKEATKLGLYIDLFSRNASILDGMANYHLRFRPGKNYIVYTSMVSASRREEGRCPGRVHVVRATPSVPTFCAAAAVSAITWTNHTETQQQKTQTHIKQQKQN